MGASDHRITRTVCQDDATWSLDCLCEVRLFGKDRAAVMRAWDDHLAASKAPPSPVEGQQRALALVREADSTRGWDKRHRVDK